MVKKKVSEKKELQNEYILEFKYGVSRARNTYGYNIISLYVDGKKVASCSGGGYDLTGTCVGEWILKTFLEELKTLEGSHRKEGQSYSSGLYGLHFYTNKEAGGVVAHAFFKEGMRVSIDGGCGLNSMERILHAIGYSSLETVVKNVYRVQRREKTK